MCIIPNSKKAVDIPTAFFVTGVKQTHLRACAWLLL
nr:MAG TPA: hypothetical protein [Crassvirales sp.]